MFIWRIVLLKSDTLALWKWRQKTYFFLSQCFASTSVFAVQEVPVRLTWFDVARSIIRPCAKTSPILQGVNFLGPQVNINCSPKSLSGLAAGHWPRMPPFLRDHTTLENLLCWSERQATFRDLRCLGLWASVFCLFYFFLSVAEVRKPKLLVLSVCEKNFFFFFLTDRRQWNILLITFCICGYPSPLLSFL